MKKYEIVYTDFPWAGYTPFGTAQLAYNQLTEREIAEFDWSRWLAPRAAVFSWATGPKMDVAFRCAEEWAERHKLRYQGVAYVWVKTTKDGVPIGAAGPRPRMVKPLAEFVLVFSTRPNERVFPLLTEAQVQHVLAPATDEELAWLGLIEPLATGTIMAPKQRVHSRKPAAFRDNIVELLGDRPRIELFARERFPGWDAWGDEL